MKVLHLRAGRKYDVWAMCDDDENCQVLDTLKAVRAVHPELVATISALLLEEVPHEGPPFHDPRRAKRLYRDLVYELKADKEISRHERIGLRIAFFFDVFDAPVVVCTNAFSKTGSSTRQEDLDLALSERSRYFEHKADLEFIEVPYDEQGY